MNLYLDFDGVIVDSIRVTYKMLEEKGISVEDTSKVQEFYRELDWFKLLDDISQINKILLKNEVYNLYILTTVNSLKELEAKVKYLRGFGLNIPVIAVPKGVNKSELVDAKNSILVDDYSGNLYPWEKAGGIGVKFTEKVKEQSFITVNSLGELNQPQFMKRLIRKI